MLACPLSSECCKLSCLRCVSDFLTAAPLRLKHTLCGLQKQHAPEKLMRLGPGTQPVPACPLVKGRLPDWPARQAPPAEVPVHWPVQRTQVQLRVRQAAKGRRG